MAAGSIGRMHPACRPSRSTAPAPRPASECPTSGDDGQRALTRLVEALAVQAASETWAAASAEARDNFLTVCFGRDRCEFNRRRTSGRYLRRPHHYRRSRSPRG
jgi:hypothetical protein